MISKISQGKRSGRDSGARGVDIGLPVPIVLQEAGHGTQAERTVSAREPMYIKSICVCKIEVTKKLVNAVDDCTCPRLFLRVKVEDNGHIGVHR